MASFTKADLPDAIDSGGSRNVFSASFIAKLWAVALGVAGAAIALFVGLGLVSRATPTLSGIPVVGPLISAGSSTARMGPSGGSKPPGWGGA